jgi:hypothetical protein
MRSIDELVSRVIREIESSAGRAKDLGLAHAKLLAHASIRDNGLLLANEARAVAADSS